jgi:hypothetical protein
MRRLLVFSYHFPPSSEVAGKPTARFVRRLPEHGWQATVLIPPTWSLFQLDPTAYADIERYARVEQTGIWLDPFSRRSLARIRKHQAANGSHAPATWAAMDEQDAKRGRSRARAWASRCLGPVKTVIRDLSALMRSSRCVRRCRPTWRPCCCAAASRSSSGWPSTTTPGP